VPGESGIARDHRAGQAARAPRRELDHLGGSGVLHDRGDRPEGLDLMRLGPAGVTAQEQRRDERTPDGVSTAHLDVLRVAEHQPPGGEQPFHAAPDFVALLQAGQGAHPDGLGSRVAHSDPGQLPADRLGHRVGHASRDKGPPDRRALLTGLDRHLRDQLPDVQLELRAACRDVWPQDGAVQRICLGAETDRPAHDDRMGAQLPGGRG
jgi:hypothetical protein